MPGSILPSRGCNTTKDEVDHNLWGVYQEDVQICLKYPGNYTYWVDDAAGGSVINGATLSIV